MMSKNEQTNFSTEEREIARNVLRKNLNDVCKNKSTEAVYQIFSTLVPESKQVFIQTMIDARSPDATNVLLRVLLQYRGEDFISTFRTKAITFIVDMNSVHRDSMKSVPIDTLKIKTHIDATFKLLSQYKGEGFTQNLKTLAANCMATVMYKVEYRDTLLEQNKRSKNLAFALPLIKNLIDQQHKQELMNKHPDFALKLIINPYDVSLLNEKTTKFIMHNIQALYNNDQQFFIHNNIIGQSILNILSIFLESTNPVDISSIVTVFARVDYVMNKSIDWLSLSNTDREAFCTTSRKIYKAIKNINAYHNDINNPDIDVNVVSDGIIDTTIIEFYGLKHINIMQVGQKEALLDGMKLLDSIKTKKLLDAFQTLKHYHAFLTLKYDPASHALKYYRHRDLDDLNVDAPPEQSGGDDDDDMDLLGSDDTLYYYES